MRAALLGLLLPVSDEPKKDMDIFLKIMSMDKSGLLNRKTKSITAKDAFEILTIREREQYFVQKDGEFTSSWKADIPAAEKDTVLEKAWSRMSYDQKLTYCVRPEEYVNESPAVWKEINAHLGTKATNLKELTAELGKMRFDREPVVGDCFCGGGSVPFEAARLGCDTFASDLNPIAGLLTWADLNISGASDEKIAKLREFQQKVYDAVDKQILEWGIETNEKKERANSYLYCNETSCPECGYTVPLSPSWVIGKGTMTAAIITESNNGFNIQIQSGLNSKQINAADEMATIKSGSMYCPHCKKSVPISALRKDTSEGYGLRQWCKNEFLPRENDIFRERLYCIKYEFEEEFNDKKGELKTKRVRYYAAPTTTDLAREQKVINLLSERFSDWQEKGYIPNGKIEEGDKTKELAFGLLHGYEGISLLKDRRAKYGKQVKRKYDTLADREIAAINELAIRLLTAYYSGAPLPAELPLPHGGYLMDYIYVTTFIQDRQFVMHQQERRAISLATGAKGFEYHSNERTQIDPIDGIKVETRYVKNGSIHRFLFPEPLRRGQTHTFSFQEILEEPASALEEDFAGQSFETPTLTYRQKVVFKGEKPTIIWAYDKLSRIERPGEPVDENRLEISEGGSVQKEFIQLYGGLHSGIAWRWK